MQRFCVGIATARSVLQKNGNPPPEFEVQLNLMLCKVRAREQSGHPAGVARDGSHLRPVGYSRH